MKKYIGNCNGKYNGKIYWKNIMEKYNYIII